MGYFWTVYYKCNCPLCDNKYDEMVQFKTGVQRFGCHANVGDSIDVLDGTYVGLKIYDCCSKCRRHNEHNLYNRIEVIVKNGVVSIGRALTDRSLGNEELIRVRAEDIIQPPAPTQRQPDYPFDTFHLDARPEIQPFIATSAIISPFPIASFEFLKQAVLYYDKVVLIDDWHDLIDGREWSKYLKHNNAIYSYIWSCFKKRPAVSKKRVFDYVHGPKLTEFSFSKEGLKESMAVIDAMHNFECSIQDYFHGHVGILIDEGHLVLHEPSRIQQQFLCEWLDKYYQGTSNSATLPYLANLIYGTPLDVPFVGDHSHSQPSSKELENVLDTLPTARLRHEVIRRIVDSFAMETILLHLPRLSARSFEDVLYARDALNDELCTFRAKMREFGQDIEARWNWERLREESLSDVVRNKFQKALEDISKKGLEKRRKFARDFTFSVGKAAAAVGITVHLGFPLWCRLLIGTSSVTLDALKAITDALSDKSELATTSHMSYLWKLKQRL